MQIDSEKVKKAIESEVEKTKDEHGYRLSHPLFFHLVSLMEKIERLEYETTGEFQGENYVLLPY